jgi:hypothetical protein
MPISKILISGDREKNHIIMKKFYLFLLIPALLFAACQSGGGENGNYGGTGYTITLTAGTGGTAVATVGEERVGKAEEGTVVTISATANEGYAFGKWTSESGGVEFQNAEAAATTFTMPDRNVTIRAEFTTTPPINSGEIVVTKKANIGTMANANGSLVYYEGKIHLICRNGEWWEYDIERDEWSDRLHLPSSYNVSAFVVNNELFIGYNNEGGYGIYKYDKTSTEWTLANTLSDGYYDNCRHLFVLDNKAYLSCYSSSYYGSNIMLCFDPEINEVTIVMTSGEYNYPVAGTYNGRGYNCNGYHIQEFNPVSNTWIDKITISAFGNQYLLINGQIIYYDYNGTICIYDLKKNEVTSTQTIMPVPQRIRATAIVVNNVGYIVGGSGLVDMYEIKFK